MKENILIINPGSTSTKIAIFNQEEKEIFKEIISHSPIQISIGTRLNQKKDNIEYLEKEKYRI